MTTSPITAAGIRALAAYRTALARSPSPVPAPAEPAAISRGAAARQVVRQAPGLSVELSGEARAALITAQSAASGDLPRASGARTRPRAATPSGLAARPGGRLDLTV